MWLSKFLWLSDATSNLSSVQTLASVPRSWRLQRALQCLSWSRLLSVARCSGSQLCARCTKMPPCLRMRLEQCERPGDRLCLGTSVSFSFSSANLCYAKNMSISCRFQIDFNQKSRINRSITFLFDINVLAQILTRLKILMWSTQTNWLILSCKSLRFRLVLQALLFFGGYTLVNYSACFCLCFYSLLSWVTYFHFLLLKINC